MICIALIVAGITWIVLEQRRADVGSEVRVELMRGVLFADTDVRTADMSGKATCRELGEAIVQLVGKA